MSRQTGLWLALCGIALGAAAAIYLRLHTAPPEAPGLPPPTSIAATTPSERQEPSRYVDARLGFSLTAPPGWINETSGVLRKQFTGARGVLVKTGTDNAVYVRVGALDLGGQRPDAQQFLTATKQALATGGRSQAPRGPGGHGRGAAGSLNLGRDERRAGHEHGSSRVGIR